MLNKNIVLGIIASIGVLSYVPTANASYYDRDDNYYYDNDHYARDYYNDFGYYHQNQKPKAYKKVNRNSRKQARREANDFADEQSVDRTMPSTIAGGNVIKVDLGKLAWGAYDAQGNLVKSGRASGGKSYCPDIKRSCRTITGTYTIYRKQGSGCKSSRFPVGKGGAPMPYCMHFKGGYALHGGNVPNHNASHGCVRVPVADAEWLNHNFVQVGRTRVSISY